MKKVLAVIVTIGVLGLIIGVVSKKLVLPNKPSPEYSESVLTSENDPSQDIESYSVDFIDADEYYENNATVLAVIPAEEAKDVQTESEISTEFEDRGFTQFPITTDYLMDGTYLDESKIDNTGKMKHPIYTTYYVTSSDELWTIISVNGKIIANPVSFNMQSELPVRLIVSESESLNSYDSYSNRFFEIIPNESMLINKVIDRIDADALETLIIDIDERQDENLSLGAREAK